MQPACAPTLSASPTTVAGGQNISVTRFGTDSTPGDGLGLFAATAPDSAPLVWVYTRAPSGTFVRWGTGFSEGVDIRVQQMR